MPLATPLRWCLLFISFHLFYHDASDTVYKDHKSCGLTVLYMQAGTYTDFFYFSLIMMALWSCDKMDHDSNLLPQLHECIYCDIITVYIRMRMLWDREEFIAYGELSWFSLFSFTSSLPLVGWLLGEITTVGYELVVVKKIRVGSSAMLGWDVLNNVVIGKEESSHADHAQWYRCLMQMIIIQIIAIVHTV